MMQEYVKSIILNEISHILDQETVWIQFRSKIGISYNRDQTDVLTYKHNIKESVREKVEEYKW